MHIQNTNKISIVYGVYPNARLEVPNMDPPLEGRLEAWGYVYDGATATLFRSDFHIPPDGVKNFVSTIDDSDEALHIGSLPGAPDYRGDMDFYGMIIYPRAFAPNEMMTMYKYLNSRIRGIGT